MKLLKKIGWFFKLCGICISMCWRGYISYMGWSALVHGIGLIIGYLGEYLVLFTMIHNFPGVGGFGALEVCFLYAIGLVTYALGNFHTRMFWQIDRIVQRGELDQYLIRPVSPLMQLLVWDLQVGYISHAILGIGSMLLVYGLLGLSWAFDKWLLLALTILSGSLIMGGISLVGTPVVFWWGKSSAVAIFLRGVLRSTLRYPMSAYPMEMRRALYIIPYAFVAYIPCLYLFDKPGAHGPLMTVFICFAAGILVNLVFWVFWRAGLRRYNSAGG
ncbi:MAG: ABC transporter permease [Christensenellales bacterium]|jgi:ABC-2 type transport system permease protein